MLRVCLWITGVAAALLFARVGFFTIATLAPHLECCFGAETRFWGYGPETFTRCFGKVPQSITAQYQVILLGMDRALAVALAAFLILWAFRSRAWVGVGAAMAYGLSDWFENAYLVAALAGDTAAIGAASVLTIAKFACLTLTIGALYRAARQRRSDI